MHLATLDSAQPSPRHSRLAKSNGQQREVATPAEVQGFLDVHRHALWEIPPVAFAPSVIYFIGDRFGDKFFGHDRAAHFFTGTSASSLATSAEASAGDILSADMALSNSPITVILLCIRAGSLAFAQTR